MIYMRCTGLYAVLVCEEEAVRVIQEVHEMMKRTVELRDLREKRRSDEMVS